MKKVLSKRWVRGSLDRSHESELWRKMQGGDPEALELIFKWHYPYLYDYGLKISRKPELVKDCIQDVFVHLWERRGRLSQVVSVRAYLMVSLRRLLFKKLQRAGLSEVREDVYPWEPFDGSFSPEDFLIYQERQAEERRIIREGILKIPPKLREALYLRTYQELSYSEIAHIMDISPQVARNYVSQAFGRLRLWVVEKLRQVHL